MSELVVTKINSKYMMATTAMHQLGDISRQTHDLCTVNEETEKDFIGSWVCGLGFFGVKFPKTTTRELTDDETKHYQGMKLVVCGLLSGTKSYDCGSIQL